MSNQRRTRKHSKQNATPSAFARRTQPAHEARIAGGLARPVNIARTSDVFVRRDDGTVARPTVTVMMDAHTRMIMGWHVS